MVGTNQNPNKQINLLGLMIRRRTVLVGLIMLTIIVVSAALAPWITPGYPFKMDIIHRLTPPNGTYWFGTDEFGYDVFTRTVFGGRLSLLVGFSVVILSTLVGVLFGLLGGYFRHLDAPIARVIDAMMAFPDILLAISLMAAFGPSLVNVILALGIVYAPRVARIVRAATLVIRELPYIEAARALGVRTDLILIRHVLRNLISPIVVQATFIFAYSMLAEAGLSFLGVGVSPEIPTWGNMISSGREFVGKADWMMVFPGIAIVVSVLSLQIIGDGLRDILDPKLRKDL